MLPLDAPAPCEAVPPEEPDAIAQIVAAIQAQVTKQAQADHFARRDAHAKAHAIVQARFTVLENLSPELRVGVFAEPRTFDAWVRFSNGAGEIRADLIPDGRGMAVKLLGVTGSASTTQDFLMIDNPAFFVRNAHDYVKFSTESQGLFFLSRLHEAEIAGQIALRPPGNPLAMRFWSMTPFALGAHACKFSVRPASPHPETVLPLGQDYMHNAMVRYLAEQDAVFDFMVQLRATEDLPIEDPTIEWSEDDAPFVTVARITIPRQSFDSADQRVFGENLSFTPWHCLPEHRPLGGINRVRRAVYEAISTYRHEFNQAERTEPATLPALPVPVLPGQTSTITDWCAAEIFDLLVTMIEEGGYVPDWANKLLVNVAVKTTRNRPHPWSAFGPDFYLTDPANPAAPARFIDYPCWDGLFDRKFLAMHLRPVTPPADLPSVRKVGELFARPEGGQRLSNKSTCLFPAFAQYLTDGFIRTDPTDTRRTTSNHEIDLCPLYGRTRTQTLALRLKSEAQGAKGRLKTSLQETAGGRREEFSPMLYDTTTGGLTDPEFAALDTPLMAPGQAVGTPAVPPPLPNPNGPPLPADRLASLFAVGGDRVNSSPFAAMINTLLLREHNRVAGMLEANNPEWDDEHVFQVARNIIIVMFIKIVIEEYISHIAPLPRGVRLKADPSTCWHEDWNRPNWMTEEFSLLYRWHSLMPDKIQWGGVPIPLTQFTLDNTWLLKSGLDDAYSYASAQPTAEMCAFNTETSVLLPIEWLSVSQGRNTHLPPYVAYRQAFGQSPVTDFSDISSDPEIQAKLKELYGSVDRVELYPGLRAEDRVKRSPLPNLLMKMVAVDAFSQALPNPLLSEHIWGDDATRTLAFSQEGYALIEQTSSLEDILKRQGRAADAPPVTMTQPTWDFINDA
jgi:prostaglandin-endoperoxide synthase 2